MRHVPHMHESCLVLSVKKGAIIAYFRNHQHTDMNESCTERVESCTPHKRHDSLICATWFVDISLLEGLKVGNHGPLSHTSQETWLVRMWNMTHSYARRYWFICQTRLVHTWDMTHSYRGHASQKSPINSGSFAENDMQLKASFGSPLTSTVSYME